MLDDIVLLSELDGVEVLLALEGFDLFLDFDGLLDFLLEASGVFLEIKSWWWY